MKKTFVLIIVCTLIFVINGWGSGQKAHSGFLSDYTQLQKESSSVLLYLNQANLRSYSAYIVDPVQGHVNLSDAKLTDEQMTDLSSYMHEQITLAVKKAGKKVAYQPGPGVARIRAAITDLEKTNAVNMIPQASLLGAGVGGASMEAAIVDSVSGKQVGAVIQSGKGSRIPLTNLGDWTAAKSVMDGWGKQL